MVLVGRVARAHGNRGQVIVNPETDFPAERFDVDRTFYIRRGDRIETLEITTVRFHQGRPIVGLRGVDTMSDAEALAGAELRVPHDALMPLPRGMFYRHDLVGCRVVTTSGVDVGVVVAVEGSVQGSRLVVDNAGAEVLVPLVADICVEVDTPGRQVVVDLPQGLLQLNS